MPVVLVDNTTKQGLFNRLKAIYDFVSRAEAEARDATNGFAAFVSRIYDRYKTNPDLLGDAYTPILNTFNTKFANAVALARSKAVDTLVGTITKELEIVDNNLQKSVLALIYEMVSQNQTVGRPNNRQINVSASANNAGIADVLVTDLVPLPWGAPGLTDPVTGTVQPVDRSALALYETIELTAVRSENAENQEIPARFSVVGDMAREPSNDYTWLDGGSGIDTEIDMILPESEQNFIPNPSFESISDVDGPTGWDFYDKSIAWGGSNPWFYSNTTASHKTRSIVLRNVADGNKKAYAILRRSLEPFTVYFLLFDAFANKDMPPGAKLNITIKDSSGRQILATDPAVGFYNSELNIPFGGSGNIPENTSNFGTVHRVLVTNNKVLRERAYRVEIGITLGSGENWPTDGLVFIDRMVLVPATNLYPLGLNMVVIGGKKASQPVRINDKWIITVTSTPETYEYWHFVFQHLFNIRGMGLQLPMSNSPTITSSNVD